MRNKREVLFRGTRKDNEEWMEGDLLQSVNMGSYIGVQDTDGYRGYAIDLETVGQFTGLTDKNGRKIFEGDLVKEKSNEYIGIVRFGEYSNSDCGDKYFGVCVEWISENAKLYKQNLWFWLNNIGIEVIGNIFDNPELMEEA